MPSPQQAPEDGWIDVPQPKAAPAGGPPGGVRGAVSSPAPDDGWVDVPPAGGNQPDADGWIDVPTPGGDESADKPDTFADVEKLGAERDGGGTGIVYAEDLAELGRVHGVDPSELKGWVGYLTGTLAPEAREGVEHVTEGLKSTAGVMTSGVFAGLAKKWAVADESKRRALDDLASLIDERKSALTAGAEMASGVVAPAIGGATKLVSGASKAVRAGVAVAEATGLGATYGYASSKEGEEMLSTGIGAGFGLIFGAGGARLASKLERRAAEKLAQEAPEVAEQVSKGAEDAVTVAGRAYEAAQDAEAALQQAVVHTPAIREAGRARDIVKFMDSTTPEQRRLLATLADAEAKLPKRAVQAYGEETARAYEVVRETTEQFDRAINVGSRQGGIRDRLAGGDGDFIEKQFVTMRQSKYLDREISKLSGTAATGTGALTRAAKVMSDLRYVTDSIDRRLQTRITPDLDRLSASFNRFTDDLRAAALLQKGMHGILIKAEREAAKAGGKFDLYAALEEPVEALSKYTETQQQAIKAWRMGWDTLRETAAKRGLPIAELTDESGKKLGYVFHKAVDSSEFVQRMEKRAEELGLGLNRVLRGEYQDVPDAAIQSVLARAEAGDQKAVEFVAGLKLAGGKPVTSVTQARAALNEMADTTRVGHNLESIAGSALQRGTQEGGGIPEFLRERDVTKLFMMYANSVFRHAHLRGDLDTLRGWAQAVERRDPIAAGYIRRYVEDLVGVRAGSTAEARGKFGDKMQIAAMRAARRAKSPAARAYYTAAARLPDLLPQVSGNMYAYYLGARLDKVAENLTSPFTVGLASTGPKSIKYWLGGTADVILAYGRGPKGMRRLKQELVERGLMPADQTFEAHRWMRSGLERSWFKRQGTRALDGLNHLAMFLYQQSDAITRGITLQASKRMASAMQKGEARAVAVIEEMSPGYQAEVRELLARGEDVTDSISRWLNGYTQFNYNRASMSEYGRFMGGLFSTFSKWPTSTFGEIAYRVEAAHDTGKWSPHMAKLAHKYFGPWLALGAVSRVVRAGGDLEAINPFYDAPKWGEADPQLAQALPDPGRLTPLGTIGGLITSAPGPRGAYDVTKKLIDGEPDAAGMAALRAAIPFAPGSVALRFMLTDLPAWRGEARREGTARTLLEELGIAE